mmetsp:Transcript_25432/g.52172  ORF Transcript_25432/g.52172 Transcript_25432/m.52172 type:complete len:275 (+) Transcript_25432:440-1264(+)
MTTASTSTTWSSRDASTHRKTPVPPTFRPSWKTRTRSTATGRESPGSYSRTPTTISAAWESPTRQCSVPATFSPITCPTRRSRTSSKPLTSPKILLECPRAPNRSRREKPESFTTKDAPFSSNPRETCTFPSMIPAFSVRGNSLPPVGPSLPSAPTSSHSTARTFTRMTWTPARTSPIYSWAEIAITTRSRKMPSRPSSWQSGTDAGGRERSLPLPPGMLSRAGTTSILAGGPIRGSPSPSGPLGKTGCTRLTRRREPPWWCPPPRDRTRTPAT